MEDGSKAARGDLLRILDSFDALVYVADMQTYEILYVNQSVKNLFGDIIGKTCWKYMQSGKTGPCGFCSNKHLLDDSGNPKDEPYQWELKNTINGRWYDVLDRAVQWGDGRIVRLEIAYDITEKKEIEDELAYSRRYLESIFRNEPECVKLLEPDGTLIDMNPAGLAMIDVDDIEMVRGQNVNVIVDPDHREQFAELTRKVCAGGTGILQFRMTGLKGSKRWLETHAVPFYDEKRGRNILLGVTRDITEQKLGEEKLLNNLKEKEFLIKEVNHRVKNNLAILQSLISMQMMSVSDPEAKEHLENVSNRIRTLSLVHERLYRTDDVSRIEMSDYVPSLARHIYDSLIMDKSTVRLEMDVSAVKLPVDYVIPCGLIINELLTNALKYAFPGGKSGTVGVFFGKHDGGGYRLVIRDDGVGLPEGFDMGKTEGLGMKVVQSLVSQVDGEIAVNSSRGTEFAISFKGE